MSRRLIILLVVFAVGAVAAPAAAITNGQSDGDDHPIVGQLLFYVPDVPDPRWEDPGAWYNCTGTLLSDTIVLTAGHCTFGVGFEGATTTDVDGDGVGNDSPLADAEPPLGADNGTGGNDIWINFSEEPDYTEGNYAGYVGFPPSTDFLDDTNYDRYLAREAWLDAHPDWIRGVAYPHPQYNDNAFFLWDAGIVTLIPLDGESVPAGPFASLPTEDYLNGFVGNTKATTRFTPVGYGLEGSRPWGAWGGDTRMYASVMLINTRGVFGIDALARKLGIPNPSVVLSNNSGAAHQGGTCFGDSGGPVFEGDTFKVVAVTSFGMNGNCAGTGGAYRIDQADDLAFIGSFLP